MSTCIPYAFGVPGLGAPPNWWDNSQPNNSPQKLDTRLEDPRWRGSYAQGFGAGIAEETTFRALYHSDNAGVRSLYLSWHVKYDAASSPNQDKIYVGLAASGAAQPLILRIVVYAADPIAGTTAVPPASIEAGTRNAAGLFQALVTQPDWIATSLRVWRNPTTGHWAVQLRVPMKPGAALTDNDGADLNPLGTFRIWYCYDIYTPTNAAGGSTAPDGGIVRLHWPTTAAFGFTTGLVYPLPSAYEEYTLGSLADPSCPASGAISLTYFGVGTTNIPSSDIDINNPNTLFAFPINNSGADVAANQIMAHFAIANWGSIASPTAPWTTIRDNEPNQGLIPNGTTATLANGISFSWTVPGALADEFRNGTKSRHQCMFVELSGAGLTFNPASVYRNMDFVGASTFTRQAEISVVGLRPISPVPRDVYLAVESRNMPARVDPEEKRRTFSLTGRALSESEQEGGLLERITDYVNNYGYDEEKEQSLGALQEQLDNYLPTYRIHCYYDTGVRETNDGKTYAILGLQSGFGYYAIHEGDLEGWSHRLNGAIRIAENFYVLRVPNNGTAKITTTIQAVEPGEIVEPEPPIVPWPEPLSPPKKWPWWVWLLLILLILFLMFFVL